MDWSSVCADKGSCSPCRIGELLEEAVMATQNTNLRLGMFLEWDGYERPFRELDNPEKSVCVHLVVGKAAGPLDIFYSLFPPPGISRRPLVQYTFSVLETGAAIPVTLAVRRFENGADLREDSLVLGTLDMEYLRLIGIRLPEHQLNLVGVRYNLRQRQGHMFLRREMYNELVRPR